MYKTKQTNHNKSHYCTEKNNFHQSKIVYS